MVGGELEGLSGRVAAKHQQYSAKDVRKPDFSATPLEKNQEITYEGTGPLVTVLTF